MAAEQGLPMIPLEKDPSEDVVAKGISNAQTEANPMVPTGTGEGARTDSDSDTEKLGTIRLDVEPDSDTEDRMPWGQAIFSFIFGIALPSADVITDWLLAAQLLSGTIALNPGCMYEVKLETMEKFGLVVMVCPTLSLLFTCLHWYRLEKTSEMGGSGRRKTLIFLLLNIWPQYKCCQVLLQILFK